MAMGLEGSLDDSFRSATANMADGTHFLLRRRILERLRPLATPDCAFVNLPETRRSHWGEGLTADDMEKCVWVRPEVVAQIEFLEWTEGDHLRHSKFTRLRDDKDARRAVKEHAEEA
jgi:bifunctional non-homologous end joining protein LigD